MNKFEKFFPLPWKSDSIVYLWSTNNQTPAMIDDDLWTSQDNEMLDNICKMINGEIEPTFENVVYDREDQTIRSNDNTLLIIRGWGFLNTHLDSKEAAMVQDEMGEWIANKLRKQMERELIFAVDIDGVLRDNLSKMLEIYNHYFDDDKTRDDVVDFKCEKIFPRIEKETGVKASEWFFQLHSKEVFEDSLPFEGASEAFKGLQQYGKVIIVSYQKTTENKIQALKWLEKNGFPTTDVCFLKDKTLLHTDYLIDDNDWNFKNTNVKHAVLIDAPYNKDITSSDVFVISGNNLMSAQRSKTLLDFYNKFKLYKKIIYLCKINK